MNGLELVLSGRTKMTHWILPCYLSLELNVYSKTKQKNLHPEAES